MDKLIAKLHPLERQVIPLLSKYTTLSALSQAAKMQPVAAMRALQWLENKQVVILEKKSAKQVVLDKNGLLAKEKGLPEKRFFAALTNTFVGVDQVAKKAQLEKGEVNVCVGQLKRLALIELEKGKKGLAVKKSAIAQNAIKGAFAVQEFLALNFPVDFSTLDTSQKRQLDDLLKRKQMVKVEEHKDTAISLTTLGKKLVKADIPQDVINRITPSMLKDGSWKDKDFRAYDVEVNVPSVLRGREHFVNEAVAYVKKIWLDLGFTEMSGDFVDSAFWDLDALFVPQDHPAREMQDTFYVKGKATLPKFWKKVKEVHENGGDTGSIGWGCTYSQEEAKKVMLRTHTTVLSAKTLATLKKEDLPAKFFSVNKVFRNEALDWKHLFEFYQVEGIVVDPDANLQHLIGYLKTFYKKMGFADVRVRPAYFPYTSPSLEVDVFHPVKKEWVEFGGAGIFRPEVVKPLLGFECPVLAWGQGMGRMISEYWNITDIRELYKNDLGQLRRQKVWLR